MSLLSVEPCTVSVADQVDGPEVPEDITGGAAYAPPSTSRTPHSAHSARAHSPTSRRITAL
jgi:hypothetical protein